MQSPRLMLHPDTKPYMDTLQEWIKIEEYIPGRSEHIVCTSAATTPRKYERRALCLRAVPRQTELTRLAVLHSRLHGKSDAKHGHCLAHGPIGTQPSSATLEGL